MLVGNVGDRFWDAFTTWRQGEVDDLPDPLDRWTRAVMMPIAEAIGADAILPVDRPYPPFQTWAMRAEALRASPLGILMHPVYGMWQRLSRCSLHSRRGSE